MVQYSDDKSDFVSVRKRTRIKQTLAYRPFSSGIRTPELSGLAPDTPFSPAQKYAATASKRNIEETITDTIAIGLSTVNPTDKQWAMHGIQAIKQQYWNISLQGFFSVQFYTKVQFWINLCSSSQWNAQLSIDKQVAEL